MEIAPSENSADSNPGRAMASQLEMRQIGSGYHTDRLMQLRAAQQIRRNYTHI